MIADVTVKTTDGSTVAYLPMKGSFSQIPGAFQRLYEWVGKRGFTPNAPPIGVYYNSPGEVAEEELLWELQAPMAGAMTAQQPDADGVGIKKVEPLEVASARHRGPYEEVGKFYEALSHWIDDNGYVAAGPPEEVYLSEPNTPPADILTEVRVPVRRR
jgi:effector-binding domain-containing protein